MDTSERWLAFAVAMIILLLATLFYPLFAYGHEHGRTDPAWEQLTQEERDWYKTLMRPDMPTLSCCGESDQYWCDIIHVRDGKTFCTITDDREDNQFKREHVPLGTEIEIPNEKLKWDRGNPTGHAIVFISSEASGRMVFCFVQSTGG